MGWRLPFLFCIILYTGLTINLVIGQQYPFKYFLRPGRASRSPDDFENFFLKASKSVPRIGRRDSDMNANYYDGSTGYYRPNMAYPHVMKRLDNSLRGLSWSDIADNVEYYPELLISPGMLSNMKNYDFPTDDKRMEAGKTTERNKEIIEYRLQPE